MKLDGLIERISIEDGYGKVIENVKNSRSESTTAEIVIPDVIPVTTDSSQISENNEITTSNFLTLRPTIDVPHPETTGANARQVRLH